MAMTPRSALRARVEMFISVVLTLAAVAIALAVVRREFFPAATRIVSADSPQAMDFYTDWRDLVKNGVTIGDASAPIQIVEFIDLECPACRYFHRGALRRVSESFGDSISITFVHLPLDIHRFAAIAAHAAECANEQQAFGAFVDVVFAQQDSIGLKPWQRLGAEAGARDSVAFLACMDRAPHGRIDKGRNLAESLEIRGTPTIYVNGWRFLRPPSDEDLAATIDDVLEGRTPRLARGST